MSAETITPAGFTLSPTPSDATASDAGSGGAGRGGGGNGSGSPLVVVQQPRAAAPPRPAPSPSQGTSDNSLRNGFAAISHSVSGETAAIGIGFLTAGPIGAIVGGTALPALVAVSMWRARRAEHDDSANSGNDDASSRNKNGSGRDRSGSGGNRNAGGRHRSPNGTGGDRHKSPKGHGTGNGAGAGGGGANRKPKVKDPVADKLSKFGKGLADKLKNRDKNGPKGKNDRTRKDGKGPGADTSKNPKNTKDTKAKTRKDHSGDYPDDRRWRGRGHKDKPTKLNKDQRKNRGNDDNATTAPDGLGPKGPKGPNAPKSPLEDRIKLVQARREKAARRTAIKVGEKAAADAARDGNVGDPYTVKLERIRTENQWIDLELHREAQLLALAAGTEQRRSTPVSYPVATTQPAGTHTAGVAVARQIDVRGAISYRLLVAMAEQLANGLHGDDDADMADHVIELSGISAMCRNLATAVREGAAALSKTAPLHPSVVKHLNNAAVAALTAARMADTIMVVFVQAHREDIYRVIAPRIGEERWNIRNAGGSLDGAKLRSAILSAGQQRLALPAGSTPAGGGSGKVVPASFDSTKKLITLMKGFDRGHMVVCLSEVAGAAMGVEVVADAVTKLYRRMANSWPTEQVVDDTVRATAAKVRTVSDELQKAIKAAQRAHARELKLNARPRKGAHAEKKWDVTQSRRG